MTPSPANRFRSVALLGEGGMARVYLVVSEGLAGADKLVVLKLLRPELAHTSPHPSSMPSCHSMIDHSKAPKPGRA